MWRTLTAALIGGIAFKLMHAPVPWLLGPMIAVLIGSGVLGGTLRWPTQLRNAGMIIVGYTIGLSMTREALKEMSYQLPTMLLMIVLLLLFCTGIALLVSKLSKLDFKTALLGSVPGGLTQIIALAEESEGVNLTIVTVTQVIRLMMIIVCVPLIVFNPIFGAPHQDSASELPMTAGLSAGWGGLFPELLPFAIASVACAVLGSRVRFPTAYLLGPALITAVLQLSGLHGPALPSLLIDAAQLMIGAYVGLLLKPQELTNKLRTITLAIGSGALLLAGSCAFAALLTKLQPVSVPTALLSLAPGGMDQMGIIAHEIDADLSMVAGYQLFRTFFIFFAVPPLLRLLFSYSRTKAEKARRAAEDH
ncbi:AbrB family transcriptional regulator [Paenibacillus montanisoli]|uniref:AbrB family transcriptional regulator n=1 Tax=Paenibacillus montanisoli TaxID=2081970 RepID=A0A328U4N5_9BACL|nr:AbrB family transcriptional regulator [Paenibacillus montanisoli]RAP77788.1 AbrB family transcriptional regulator [Paenibacillus montanisoli]